MGNTSCLRTLASVFFLCLFVLICLIPVAGAQESAKGNEFDSLARRLIADGFSSEKIQDLLARDGVAFTPDGVSQFFVHSEARLNYDQFLSKNSIAKAFEYMTDHKDTLDRAQAAFGVNKTIITAILLVETRLGTYLGNQTVLNTLATMASLTDDALQERIWQAIPDKRKPEKEVFVQRVERRLNWGYQELKALIRFTDREGIDPENIRGSYAGAMGIPQFMPSNALILAVDGNNDGKIDLFDHTDAILSVANYLRHHGWAPDISRERQQKVLMLYNHSSYYVDTLLKISDRLRQG